MKKVKKKEKKNQEVEKFENDLKKQRKN